MELWIRTQSKDRLLKIDELEFYKAEINKWLIKCGSYGLGVYPTEQRCLEILDEIQKLMEMGNQYILTIENDCDYQTYEEMLLGLKENNFSILSTVQKPQMFPLSKNIIYQMPKE